MKTDRPLTLLQKITPMNREDEKRKFFFDPQYNPQFEYEEEASLEEWTKYGPVSDQYLAPAKRILDMVLQQWGNNNGYLDETEGRVLSQEEVQIAVQKYLQDNDLENEVTVQYSAKQVGRTVMHKDTLGIRTPVRYREHTIEGVLNHEVGTHYFRRLNERQQPWYNHHRDFGFGDTADDNAPWTGSYLETEEGLAVLNANATIPDKHLWQAALSYFAVYLAREHSFAEVYKQLRQYVEDRDLRWTLCLKAKRGLRDTSLPGAFSKNQLYFSGAVKVARWLVQHDFAVEDLYLGKLALEDIEKAKEVTQLNEVRLPRFLHRRQQYREAVEEILAVNKLETLIHAH